MFIHGIIAEDSDGTLCIIERDDEASNCWNSFSTVNTYMNGMAISALDLGLLGQTVISTWCLLSSYKLIFTWSSNPLNYCLALLHESLELEHRGERCMSSVHEACMMSESRRPSAWQKRARAANRSVLCVTIFAWILAILAFIWALVPALSQETQCTRVVRRGPSQLLGVLLRNTQVATKHGAAVYVIRWKQRPIQYPLSLGRSNPLWDSFSSLLSREHKLWTPLHRTVGQHVSR